MQTRHLLISSSAITHFDSVIAKILEFTYTFFYMKQNQDAKKKSYKVKTRETSVVQKYGVIHGYPFVSKQSFFLRAWKFLGSGKCFNVIKNEQRMQKKSKELKENTSTEKQIKKTMNVVLAAASVEQI